MKIKITLGIVVILGLIITNVTASPRNKIKFVNVNTPYLIYLEKITKKDVEACRADENCMDIMSITDHITREDQTLLEQIKAERTKPPYCKTQEQWDAGACILHEDDLPLVYAMYWRQCYDVTTKFVLSTDYCLEVGERLGIVWVDEDVK